MSESRVYDFDNNTVTDSNGVHPLETKAETAEAKTKAVEDKTEAAEKTTEHTESKETTCNNDKINLSKENDSIDLSKSQPQYEQQRQQNFCNQQQNFMCGQQQNFCNRQQNGYNKQQNPYSQQQNFMCGQPDNLVYPSSLSLEPALAALLSIVIVGLGQMINGQLEKGLILMFVGYISVTIVSLLTCGFGLIMFPVLLTVSAIDAYKCAEKLQSGQCIEKYEFHLFE